MDTFDAPMKRREKPVSVSIGVAPRVTREKSPPPLALVGIASWRHPLLSRIYPNALVRDSQFVDEDGFVEHVRLSSRDALELLPGLEFGRPSRMRDAVRVVLGTGVPFVDVILVRMRTPEGELMPWELYHPDVLSALDPFMSMLVGTVLVYPDIGGPVPMGPGTADEVDERVHRFVRTVKAHSEQWVERYQLALLDDIGAGGEQGIRLLRAAAATDSAVCRWVGQGDDLRAHGWRSAAALVGGLLASRPNDLLSGVSGFKVPLLGGRKVDVGRAEELYVGDRHRARLPEDDYYVDVVPDVAAGTAFVRSESTMRAPVGAWSIPSIRVAKVIHWRIMQAASGFVFDTADVSRAMGLASAITKAVAPFVRVGVLTGHDSSEPLIRGGVIRDPAQPGLRVEIAAALKPWAHQINLSVNLRPGGAPVVKEVA